MIRSPIGQRSTLAIHASRLTDIPIDEISTDDILKVLQPVWLKIPETASRMRSRIERILDAAKALGHRHGENPARWRGHPEFILAKRNKAMVRHHAALPFGAMADFMAKLVRQDGVAVQALAHITGSKAERAYRRSRALRKRAELMNAWARYCLGEQFATTG